MEVSPKLGFETESSLFRPNINDRGGVVFSKLHSLETLKNSKQFENERTKIWTSTHIYLDTNSQNWTHKSS